jgi:hypothetical protein
MASFHPGHAFTFGCEQWAANDCKGATLFSNIMMALNPFLCISSIYDITEAVL